MFPIISISEFTVENFVNLAIRSQTQDTSHLQVLWNCVVPLIIHNLDLYYEEECKNNPNVFIKRLIDNNISDTELWSGFRKLAKKLALEWKAPLLPLITKDKLTVVFDLHGTLVSGTEWWNLRPYASKLLENLSNIPNVEIIIWSYTDSMYLDGQIKLIDPSNKIFTSVLDRKYCQGYQKDLKLLGRPLERIVLIEDNPIGILPEPQNGIPVGRWIDDLDDIELQFVESLLKLLVDTPDVRSVLSLIFGFYQASDVITSEKYNLTKPFILEKGQFPAINQWKHMSHWFL